MASLEVIRSLYTDCSTSLMCGGYVTKEIMMTRGVRQGCPISMLLFNIGINPLLIKLETIMTGGLLIAEHRITSLAYADDLALLAPNQSGLQDLIDASATIAHQLGFLFKPSKCSHMQGRQDRSNELIRIYGKVIPELEIEDSYRYLGVNFSHSKYCNPSQLFTDMELMSNKICNSILLPWQKLNAYIIFIHSKSIFYMKNYYIKSKEIDKIDRLVRALLKQVLGVPARCSTNYLYTDRRKGGCGLRSLRDEYTIQSLTHAFRMLSCRDTTVRDAARYSLRVAASENNNPNMMISFVEALDWLNTTHPRNLKVGSWWDKIRQVIIRAKLDHRTLIKFTINDNFDMVLKIGQILSRYRKRDKYDTGRPHTTSRMSTVEEKDTKKLPQVLRQYFQASLCVKWSNQISHGRYEPTAMSRFTSDVIFSGSLTIGQFKFIHSARTDTLPVKSRKYNDNNLCRTCGKAQETQMHVLTVCKLNLSYIRTRHDSIMSILVKYIKRNSDYMVYADEICQYTNSMLRVDLQIEDTRGKTIFLIDIKCPMDEIRNIQRADDKNIQHYKQLRKDILKSLPGWKIDLKTFIVGCLGTWAGNNDRILRSLKFTTQQIKEIARECIKSNIKWSHEQWRFHQGRHCEENQPNNNTDDTTHFDYYRVNFDSESDSEECLETLFQEAKHRGDALIISDDDDDSHYHSGPSTHE